MNNFDEIFKKYILDNSTWKNELYLSGIQLIKSNNLNVYEKEIILNKLCWIFPEKYELDYYLGYIFKDIDVYKALRNFHICWIKNKYYIENLLDYTKILFESELIDKINELNVDNYFDNIIDHRFMILVANLYIRKHKIKKAENILLSIINSDNIDNKIKIMAYCNISGIHGKIINIQMGILYLFKALSLVELDKKNIDIIKPIITDILLLKDYMYPDNDKNKIVFFAYKIMNWIYPQIHKYNFTLSNNSGKIKIAYMSYDFVNSVVTNFILPVIKSHSYDNFEIYLLNNNNKNLYIDYANNQYTTINIGYLSDNQVADLIYQKGINILIDLSGHTGGNRLGVFSLNPSPCQITWIGYPNTTGLSSIKYRFGDEITDPYNTTQYYSEKIIRLPKCFLLFENVFCKKIVIKNYENINNNNYIILGSLNKDTKISDELLECWKSILSQNIMTKIIIKINSIDSIEYNITYYADKLDIDKSRVEIIGYISNDEYYELFSRIDILLDTFPYSGTTTTCNALLHSVPVVTYYFPNSHVHNVSSSLLINSGFPELVAYSKIQYIDKVVNLTRNLDKIIYYRNNISKKFNDLMNSKQFMIGYENILKKIYNSEI